ncbi:MAG: hypothetical protein K2G16_03290 [Lachnospiraceae bacterium]|nr:hypothetical protein [Lachnospiraceae bacterium]
MLYSLMNSNADYYVNLHGEQVIGQAEKSVWKGTDCIWQREPVSAGLMQRIAATDIQNERLFIDFEGILQRQIGGEEDIQKMLEHLHSRENTVYLMNIVEETGIYLEKGLEKKGIAMQREQAEGGEWFCEVFPPNGERDIRQAAMCEKAIHDIHMDNLLILMADSPKGKTFPIDRLLRDGETCLYYFFYRLAMRLVEKGMAKPFGENRDWLCFVPDNPPAIPIAKALAVFLGAEVKCDEEQKSRFRADREYIIVRDVFHMSCELDRLSTAISLSGGQVKGVACLVDIYTGVGDRKNRVSLHTIDLEQGISYRIKQKRENLGQEDDF